MLENGAHSFPNSRRKTGEDTKRIEEDWAQEELKKAAFVEHVR